MTPNPSQTEMQNIYQKAMTRINGTMGEPVQADFQASVLELQTIASIYPAAKAKLSMLMQLGAGTSQDIATSNALFLEAAMGGLPPLLRELGVLVLMAGNTDDLGDGPNDALRDAMGGMLLKRAAASGDWIAAFLLLREAGRGRVFLPSDTLKTLASQLSDTVPFKDEILLSINRLGADVDSIPNVKFSKSVCESALQKSSLPSHVTSKNMHESMPHIAIFSRVLCPLACDYLIAMSVPLLQPSKVVDMQKQNSIKATYRTSDGAVFLPHNLDKPLLNILWKLSHAAGIDPKHGEFLALLRYHPGQKYHPHHDYLETDGADYSKVGECGQRKATLLTYLNTGYEGGETEFPNLDIDFKGGVGDCLYFTNTDGNGIPIPDSLHAGRPVTAGKKWLVTLWMREKPFWPW